MKCKCGIALTGRQREFCSDKCRMRYKRYSKANEDGSGSPKANKPEQIHPPEPEQRKRTELFNSGQASETMEGRPPWDTGPERTRTVPIDPDVKAMSTDELVRRLHYIKDWQRSPEHQEVLRRRQEAAA